MRRCLFLGCLVLAVVVGLAGCHDSFHDSQCDIFIANDSTCDLTIFVDGWEAGLIREGRTRTVNDVGPGRHVIEAVDRNNRVVERRTLDLGRGEDYYWRISSC